MSTNGTNDIIEYADITIDELEKPPYITMDKLPDRFVAEVKNYERRVGDRGTRIVVRVEIIEPPEFSGVPANISYPRTTWPILAHYLKAFGIKRLSEMVGRVFVFQRRPGGRVQYPRHYPVQEWTGTPEDLIDLDVPSPKSRRLGGGI